MNDIRRKRVLLSLIAAILLASGFLLLGGAGTTLPAAPPPPSGEQRPAVDREAPEQFLVRDYAEFGEGPDGGPTGDWLGLFGGMFVKLALVLALMFLVLKAMARYLYRGRMPVSPKRSVALLGTLSLAPNRSVYVLEVGRKVLVVGASQTQLSLLTEITDPDAIQEVRGTSSEVPAAEHFSTLLDAAHSKLSAKGTSSVEAPVSQADLGGRMREGSEFLNEKLAELRQRCRPG
jgi:flagellar biogenesis protein FliO